MKTELVLDQTGAYWLASGRIGRVRIVAEGETRRESIRAFCELFNARKAALPAGMVVNHG